MAVKKSTPSNIKLTLKTAHELAKRNGKRLDTGRIRSERLVLHDGGESDGADSPGQKQRMYYDDRKLGRWNARDYSAF